jgi:hypothetical protein
VIHLPAEARAFLRKRLRASVSPICRACRARGMPRDEKLHFSRETSERQRRIPAGWCLADALSRLPKCLQPLVLHVCSYGAIEAPYDEIRVLGPETHEPSRRMRVRRLLLETRGGMCNRLQALVSGICWAEDLSCNLVVSWPYHPYTFCRFEDLFEIRSLPSFVSITLRVEVGN